LSLKEIKSLEMNWALPLLWAVLKDDREEVRLYGRYLVHSLLWSALRRVSEDDGRERNTQDTIKSLEMLVAGQKAEIAALNSELQKKSAELDRLKEAVEAEAPRREPPKPNEDGKGRLIREIRKLRHELARERERVEELRKSMPVDSNVFMPLDFTLESPKEAECGIQQTCLRNQRHLSKGEECCREEDFCEQCPLFGLRVAVVGGLSRMQPEYREVVRQLGAEMLFHNGEVKNGSYKLKSVVCGADIVVFITSVNSHGALNVVKAVCRKNGKKFIALKETGTESLAKTLRKCAA
jgi:HAMP domain-containing protein